MSHISDRQGAWAIRERSDGTDPNSRQVKGLETMKTQVEPGTAVASFVQITC
jgi:hypothetical protein